jgi:2,3-bisphosphoglycerate-independent phosphoglycerate mutase
MKKKIMLIILDGWGEGKKVDSNAIFKAKTPFLDSIRKRYKWSLLEASGPAVGVLEGQTGGSDVGHFTMGTGQISRQPVKLIDDAITNGSFFENKNLNKAIEFVQKNNSNLHLFGIGADSMIHSYTKFLYAILDLCNQKNFPGNKVFLHLATDGRDNPGNSGLRFFAEIEKVCSQKKSGKIASIFGRILLDRGGNWERTKKLFQCLTDENFPKIENWQEFLQRNYDQKIFDQEIPPRSISDENGVVPRIKNGDSVINFNFRADRERQITSALTDLDFEHFDRPHFDPSKIFYVGLISYSPNLKNAYSAFLEEKPEICLSEILEKNGIQQFHSSGTEKFIFVTYNFNRTSEIKLPHEIDKKALQTHNVETFDKNPEMSAPNLEKIILQELQKDKNDFYVINFENGDQVGHTGDLPATIKAAEVVDLALSKVVSEALNNNFEILITADHGNAEVMLEPDGITPHTSHTSNPVPFIFISKNRIPQKIKNGELSDVAPTILSLLEIEIPESMTGGNLIDF